MGKIKEKPRPKGFAYYLRHFSKKHRLSFRDQHTDTELSYIYTSTMRIALAFFGVLLVMLAVVIAVVVYTPVLDKLPGNPGKKTREMLMENILKIDSLQNELAVLARYGENLSLVLAGKTPSLRVMNRPQDNMVNDKNIIPPAEIDSLLRVQLETPGGRYSLEAENHASNVGANTRAIAFERPVRGKVTRPADPVAKRYGVGITLDESQQILASAAGTVIIAAWTPEDGYILGIQHKDDYVTMYKRCTQLLKSVGDAVDAGEVIGYFGTTDNTAANDGRGEFVFELWREGHPADPQRYIFF